MDLKFQFKNTHGNQEQQFRDYLLQKVPAIQNLLTHFAEDGVIFTANIEKFEKHDAFAVELVLTLPMKTLMAKETSHSINKAVDLSKDRLLVQIKKQLATLRNRREHASIRQHAPEAVKENMPNYL